MAAANKNIRRTSVDKASLFVNQTDNDSHVSIDVIDLSYNQGALFLKDAENFLRRRASDSMQRFIPRINAYVSQKNRDFFLSLYWQADMFLCCILSLWHVLYRLMRSHFIV